ncbi:MAG: efflux RND transporter periplasmic adaptor subunit [Arenimonas sp.]
MSYLSNKKRLTIFLLALIFLSSCSEESDQQNKDTTQNSDTASATMAVTLAKVQTRTIERSIIASGPISAWEEMQLGVELSGVRVTSLHVDVGQSVKRGQLLLELDHRTLDSDLRQADASLSEAKAGVQLANINFNRGQQLAKSQLISASALDELRAGVVQAQARLATTQAIRDGVQLKRDFASLRAPDDGIISKRLVQPGQVVMAGSELLRLIRRGRLEWRAELNETDLTRVKTGAKIRLQTGAGETVEGIVRAVSPGLDATTRTGTLYADLPHPGSLKAGTFLEGRIFSSASQALTVPSTSLIQRDGHSYVYIVTADNTVQRIRVSSGASEQGFVEITRGLKVGDTVVDSGAGLLSDGDRVKVVAKTAEAKSISP